MQVKYKQLVGVLAVGLFTILLVLYGRTKSNSAPDIIKVGAILPLTGEAASYGVDCKHGIELALSMRSDSNVKVVFEDSKAEPKEAVAAISRLINAEDVEGVIGDMFSATTLAIAPLAQDSGVLLLTPTASEPGIPATGDKVFSIYAPAEIEGGVMGKQVPEVDIQQVITIRQNAEVFAGIEQGFREEIQKRGGLVIASEVLPSDVSAFKSLAARLSELKPSAIYLAAYKDEVAQMATALREAKIASSLFSQSTVLDEQLAKDHRMALEGVVFTGPAFSLQSTSEKIASFRAAYKREYGADPSVWSAYGFDAMDMVLEAIAISQRNGTPIHEAMKGMDYDGLTGRTRILPDRTADKEMLLYTIRDGQITTVNE